MNLLLMVVSIIPPLYLVYITNKQNDYSYHPKKLLFKLLISGAFSCIPAFIIENVMDESIFLISSTYDSFIFIYAFFGIALIEESSKFCFLYLITDKYDRYFKTFYDGIIYSACAAIGFAILENLLYVFIYTNGSLSTALLRSVTPGHFCFSIIMGMYYSEAKKYEKANLKNYSKNLALAVIIPTIVHGTYDYCIFNGNSISMAIFYILLISLYGFSYSTIKKKSKEIYFI